MEWLQFMPGDLNHLCPTAKPLGPASVHYPTLVHPDINRPPCPQRALGGDPRYSNSISLQRPGPDRRLRKASDQPSGHSQATESSGSTPESCPDLSDEDFVPGK